MWQSIVIDAQRIERIKKMSKRREKSAHIHTTDSICYGSFTVTIAQSISNNKMLKNRLKWTRKFPRVHWCCDNACNATEFKCNASNCAVPATTQSVSQSFTQSWCYLQFVQLNWLRHSVLFLSCSVSRIIRNSLRLFSMDQKSSGSQFRCRENER